MSDFKNLEKTLWTAADKLRSNMDAAEYKHVVLGLIFLKCISVAFNGRFGSSPETRPMASTGIEATRYCLLMPANWVS